MGRVPLFNSPLLLGFDHIERMLDNVSKTSSDGYPPYNIEQCGEDALRITLAVAGFARSDLHVDVEESQLVVRGKRVTDDSSRVFLHRGIATRQFQRRFVLAEGIEVIGATLENGLLHIDLRRPKPAVMVRTIPIGSAEERPARRRKAARELEPSPAAAVDQGSGRAISVERGGVDDD